MTPARPQAMWRDVSEKLVESVSNLQRWLMADWRRIAALALAELAIGALLYFASDDAMRSAVTLTSCTLWGAAIGVLLWDRW